MVVHLGDTTLLSHPLLWFLFGFYNYVHLPTLLSPFYPLCVKSLIPPAMGYKNLRLGILCIIVLQLILVFKLFNLIPTPKGISSERNWTPSSPPSISLPIPKGIRASIIPLGGGNWEYTYVYPIRIYIRNKLNSWIPSRFQPNQKNTYSSPYPT